MVPILYPLQILYFAIYKYYILQLYIIIIIIIIVNYYKIL